MKNHFRLFRYFAYSLEILVLFLLQQTPNLIPSLWGIKPTLLIPVALSIALFEKEVAAMGFGVACGLLIDFGRGGVIGFHAILLAICCYTISALVTNLFKTNLLTAVLMGLASIVLIFFFQWIFFYVFPNYGQAGYALIRHYLPRMAYTAVILPITYYFNRAFAIFLRER